MAIYSKVNIYKNTPLQNPLKTIHFASNQARDSHFDKFYTPHVFDGKSVNVAVDRYQFRLDIDYTQAKDYNYLSYENSQISRRYCRVVSIEYVRPNLTIFHTLPDPIMTFCQGNVIPNNAKNVMIDRQHLKQDTYFNNIMMLSTNDDLIKTNSAQYIHQGAELWQSFHVLFTIASDLESKFGTVDKPEYHTSGGSTYDGITSPLNLYVANQTNFNILAGNMKKYPWIWEEVKTVVQVPTQFIDGDDLQDVKIPDLPNVIGIQKFKNGAHSTGFDLNNVKWTTQQLADIFGVDLVEDKHLLRSGYCNIEGYSWDGQQLSFEPQFLNNTIGFQLHAQSNIGFNNDVRIFAKGYKSDGENGIEGLFAGQYLNNAFIFNVFNDVPVMVDNYTNALAKNANRRQLAEDRQITGRANQVLNGDNARDRVFNAVSVFGTIASKQGLSAFQDEYEFYRDQKAEFADLALSSPSVSAQTNGNSFQIANGIMGVTIKFSRPSKPEMEQIKKYYRTFGFQWGFVDNVDTIDSMSIMNFLKFSGSWFIPDVDPQLMELIRSTLNIGVQFYQDNGTANPMTQNLANNKRIK
ncbi:hypothetical protein [Lactococcus petauri]|uniref:hypothetical protein n=1 Tax=Lactococcus petauri TaxID=1940789 RepID=UPI002118997E|nr:hypothetical protein [Lactococcus petauri]MCQ8276807.1 hypothetical protein [Lactococcus petauri]MCR6590479.1 hypothetical protein [Lactococcus petauri]